MIWYISAHGGKRNSYSLQHLSSLLLSINLFSSAMNTVLLCVLVCVGVAAAFPKDQKDDGGWVVKTDQTRNGGTVVRGEAKKEWDVTQDGKVKAEVHGHWERTYGGPSHGQRDHGAGGSIGGTWGK